MSRRLLPSLCLTAACAPVAALLCASSAVAAPAVTTLQFDGKGAGHGVGLAQDSAEALAAAGASTEQVLQRFYPGTGRTHRSGLVRVSVWNASPGAQAVVVSLPTGGTAQVAGRSIALAPGTRVRLSRAGSGYRIEHLATTSTHPVAARAAFRGDGDPSADPAPAATADPTPGATGEPSPTTTPTEDPTPSTAPTPDPTASPTAGPTAAPTTTAGPSTRPSATASPTPATAPVSGSSLVLRPDGTGPLTVVGTGRSYRGTLTLVQADVLRLVNAVDVESYLQGMGEVPASWHPAALRAQAVAARTYALRAASAAGSRAFDLCDDAHCQVYLGLGNEDPRTTAAVRATRGEVVTYGGQLATTYYSANAGGLTADPVEGVGAASPVPYLPAGVVAPGGTRPWSYRITTADVATALHYPGTVGALSITQRGPSGRAEQLVVSGSAGARTVPALRAASALGLPSTLFSVAGSSLAPTAPLSPGGLQLSPDLASLDPVVAPLEVTPGEVPSDPTTAVTLATAADHGTDRAAALTIGLVVGAALTLMVIGSRRRMLAIGPATDLVVPEADTQPLVSRRAPAHPVVPAPVGSVRTGRGTPTLWLTVGAVTVGSAGALAYVKLGRARDQD